MYTWGEGIEFPVNRPWAIGFWFRKSSVDFAVLFDNRDDCYMSGAQIGLNIDGSVYAFIQGTDYVTVNLCNAEINVLDGQWHFVCLAHRYIGNTSVHYLYVDDTWTSAGYMIEFQEVLNYGHYFFSYFDGNTSTQQGFSYDTAIDALFYMEADFEPYWAKLYNNGLGVIYTAQDLPPNSVFANCDVYHSNSWDDLHGTFWQNANGNVSTGRQYFQGIEFSVSNGVGVYLPHLKPYVLVKVGAGDYGS
jgi:hypothetical protein